MTTRPTSQEAPNPTPDKLISVGSTWLNVYSVDTVNQSFQAELLIRLSWLEPVTDRVLHHFTELKEGAGKAYNISKRDFIDNCWDPQFLFPNCATDDTEEWVRMERTGDKIAVVWSVRFHSSTFNCAFNLRKFPFDRQHLAVRVSTMWDEKKVQFRRSETEAVRQAFTDCALQDYKLTQARLVDVNTPPHSEFRHAARSDPGTSTSGVRYSSAYCVQVVQRYPGYYLFNLYLPTFLISSFALSVFAFTVDQFDGRSNVIVTVLLTIVAFKQAMKQMIPTLQYVTYVDRYILAGLGLVILVAIETACLSAGAVCVATPARKPTLCGAEVLGSLEFGFVDQADQICWAVDVGLWLVYNLIEGLLIANANANWTPEPPAPARPGIKAEGQ